jgi:hypothetical protein
MVAPIFNLRNVKVTLNNSNATPIYGVVPNTTAYASLASGTQITDVTVVVLTVQCSNTGDVPVNISASVVNSGVTQYLVKNYTVIPNNAFDPLSGNLILTGNDVLQVQSSLSAGAVDVIVSLLEIANATGS